MEDETAGDQQGMGNGGAALAADADLAGALAYVGFTHTDHFRTIPDFAQGLLADAADGAAAQHVALAAGVYVTIVFDVEWAAPEVMAGVREVFRDMAAAGVHEIGFVGLDAGLVDAGDGLPEAFKFGDFVPVALHANHLDDHLDLGLQLVFQLREADEVIADAVKAGAFAVELEAFAGGAIKAEGDVFEG